MVACRVFKVRWPAVLGRRRVSSMTDRWFGLLPTLTNALVEMGVSRPTQIQALAITPLLRGKSIALGSGTGTGKTLAYALPIVHAIKEAERAGALTRNQHPRALILLPTRELERQVLSVFKKLSHSAKFRAVGISGGTKQGAQRVALDSAVDIVVATPGRLALLLEQRKIRLSDIRHVVIDEADTMLEDADFAAELRAVLGPLQRQGILATAAARPGLAVNRPASAQTLSHQERVPVQVCPGSY
jgi:superfamily II DNA/RNA helicase